MITDMNRRQFMTGTLGATLMSALGAILPGRIFASGKISRSPGNKYKLSLNAYSFNEVLRSGTMSLFDVVDFCAGLGFDGLDATGYYFPGYPEVPDDEFIYRLKKHAFVNGITINGTGVRNDFAVADPAARQNDIRMVKSWIEVAQKLGAGVIRIFAGRQIPDGYNFDQVLEWMVPDMKECVAYGQAHGVIVALQNHNDFAKTANEVRRIIDAVDSEWMGLILDIGSLRMSDPYQEIAELLPYAVSWQVKENVWYGEKAVPVDLPRLKEVIDKGGYRGFLPIETLGEGDPREKVKLLIENVRRHFA